ncbi:MAG: indole-3-glycerol-phosphate synthase TrpC, partial [Candidatus Margulisbacteria bacterium]|nr:indole-3-glycerol-phosphate synthase TrpC [Candidatus Margulisiibacteriota bacterium]
MLKEILAEKQKEIGELRKTSSIESFLETIDDTTTRNFQAAIAQPGKINIIAEIKKASPS